MSALSGIGTDAMVHGLAWGQYFQGLEPDVDNVRDSPSKDWNEMLFSFAAEVLESVPDQSSLERLWETTFRLLACFTLPKNIKPETVHLYSGAIGISNYPVAFLQYMTVNLRNNKRHIVIHTPCRRIINNNCTFTGKDRRPFF